MEAGGDSGGVKSVMAVCREFITKPHPEKGKYSIACVAEKKKMKSA